jgi:methylmalonyl-CoA/ethylmalonyl-CoA epimerase
MKVPDLLVPQLAALLPGQTPQQISLVVEDLGAAIETWSVILGSSDWSVYTYDPSNIGDLEYRGKPGEFSMRLALCGSNPQFELVQNLYGRSIYSDWTDAHGYGLHHLGYFVPSIGEAVARFSQVGLQPIQSGTGYGLDRDGGFAYYCVPGIDPIIELIEVPRRRRPSEAIPGA